PEIVAAPAARDIVASTSKHAARKRVTECDDIFSGSGTNAPLLRPGMAGEALLLLRRGTGVGLGWWGEESTRFEAARPARSLRVVALAARDSCPRARTHRARWDESTHC